MNCNNFGLSVEWQLIISTLLIPAECMGNFYMAAGFFRSILGHNFARVSFGVEKASSSRAENYETETVWSSNSSSSWTRYRYFPHVVARRFIYERCRVVCEHLPTDYLRHLHRCRREFIARHRVKSISATEENALIFFFFVSCGNVHCVLCVNQSVLQTYYSKILHANYSDIWCDAVARS